MRSKFRPGFYLIRDDESGQTVWNDEVKQTWDGQVVRTEWADDRHPQTIAHGIPRTEAPIIAKAAAPVTAFVCASSFSTVITTGVTAKVGAATHLFMQI